MLHDLTFLEYFELVFSFVFLNFASEGVKYLSEKVFKLIDSLRHTWLDGKNKQDI